MTKPTYKIEPDVRGEFLRLTLTGDWGAEIAARFADDVAATLQRMLKSGLRHGHLRTLIDMREKNVLPQEVANHFARMVRPDSPSRKIALIVSGPLHRLQTKRIADHRHAVFGDEATALAWLYAEDTAERPR
ncbi:hypothetical protein ASE95_10935 [Sphingomonas sp. Leaf231]|uniref:hypothetical protein n=1 Tax=Sphingomonas sp. Leaf231 TaxID=1736301 RepID=UPI0006FB4DE5|nr:hypothetical protein [Sphingomonas sp. Leaf231]KQN93085.1 hypothetical protein ASE95_10935 [Sphingomonas sp. Leaf231]